MVAFEKIFYYIIFNVVSSHTIFLAQNYPYLANKDKNSET